MIAIVDYGVGNLFSLESSFKRIGAEVVVTSDEKTIRSAEKILLPGVGAFEDAAKKLNSSGLGRIIKEEAKEGKDLMGICLGMQLLFEKSYEYGEHKGLGILKGEIVPMRGRIPDELKVPHIGWNALIQKKENRLFKDVKEDACMYFVHSYFAEGCEESLVAVTEYGIEITAAVNDKNVYGCQFHPEKSGWAGLAVLKAFCEGA